MWVQQQRHWPVVPERACAGGKMKQQHRSWRMQDSAATPRQEWIERCTELLTDSSGTALRRRRRTDEERGSALHAHTQQAPA